MPMKKYYALITGLLASLCANAVDYTWSGGASGDWEEPSNWLGGDGYPLAAGDKAVIPAVSSTTSIYLKPEAAATIAAEINVSKPATANAEVRLIRNTGFTVTFTGRLTGDGIIRLAADTSSGAAASSAQSIILDNDQSEFEGTFYFNSTYKDRFLLGTSLVLADRARYVVSGSQAGNIQYNGERDKLFSFASLYTTAAVNRTSVIRFNTAAATPVFEIGRANGELGDDRLTVQIGNNNDAGCSYVKIRKVGSGNLVLGDTHHSKGTELNGGTVTLVHKNALLGYNATNTGDISFGGGTLVYGESIYENNEVDGNVKGEKIATDYSKFIKNSTAAISIDTNGRDVTFATALDASNAGGLVKKGEGALVLSALPKYTGKTVVEKGSLTVPVNDTTLTAENFEVADGAEITYVNNHNYQITDKLGTLGYTATVNLLPNGSWRLWRCMGYPFGGADFRGTINFANKGLSASVDGIMNDAASIGNENVVWGVTGEPDEDNTLLLYIQGNTDGTTKGYLGALRQTSDKGVISIYRNMPVIEIGNRSDVDSVLNGAWMERTTTGKTSGATIKKVGSGRLVLGKRFRAISINDTKLKSGAFQDKDMDGSVYYPTFQITDGTFENNADLSKGFTVSVAAGVTLAGTGKWPADMTLPSSYVVQSKAADPATTSLDVDFTNGATLELDLAGFDASDKADHVIFTANSIAGVPSQSIIASLNTDTSHGTWRIVNLDGKSLSLRYFKKGLALYLR